MIDCRVGDDGVLELVIERPPVNAFDIGTLDKLAEIVGGVEQNVNAVMIRAVGRGFCAGGDLKEVEALEGYQGIMGQARSQFAACLAIMKCPVPVICAAHNFCVGAGVLIASAADILVAAPETKFVLGEVDAGATAGGAQAIKLIPERRLRAAMLTGEPITAEELLVLGSLYRIVSENELADGARAIAAIAAAKPPEVVRRLKHSFNHASKVAEVEALYRAELSYSYELNMLGDASRARRAVLDTKQKD